ncbi:glutathione S-transferase family protein [Ectothiorhodospiraceae bacterium WFHF3C12]|nr:glutathione S-transferase family protein [Ectothiorhodospiraceae bacterium WFHF3C12]
MSNKLVSNPANSDDDVTIYSIEMCPFAQRSRILLDLKQVEHDLVEIDITKPRPDWFLELNPAGKVPVITHRGKAINESSVINEYLEDVFSDPPVFPEDPYLRAQARILVDYCNKRFTPNMYRVLMEQDEAKRGRVEKAASEDWLWLEEYLRRRPPDGDFILGDFGIVDLTFAPFFERYVLNKYFWGFELPNGVERVVQWMDAVLEYPAVKRTRFSEEDYIKLYADYALGFANGAVPPGHERSSSDLTVPLAERPMPPRRR